MVRPEKEGMAAGNVINVFHLHGTYLFKYFFDDGDIFSELKPFYSGNRYRFEVPTEMEMNEVESVLEEHSYTVNRVVDVEPFCVVKPRSEPYSDILRDAVDHVTRGDHNIFVMKNQVVAEQAEIHNATPISETGLEPPT